MQISILQLKIKLQSMFSYLFVTLHYNTVIKGNPAIVKGNPVKFRNSPRCCKPKFNFASNKATACQKQREG